MNTYAAVLEWMYHRLPAFQRKGAPAYRPGLERMIAFSDYLEKPEQKFRSIHVGGTNGKGSTAHLMASVLQASGFKVGLYASPHLIDFRERIKIDGSPISEKAVMAFVQNHQPYFENQQLSFFEMTVGMAFSYFANCSVDIAVIEVGLGGRLDATNIIQPVLSVITNIGLDHTEFLGHTLEAIAVEKAGIIKQQTPIVIGEKQKETTAVFIKCAIAKKAPITFASDDSIENFKSDLEGPYQQKNIQTAVHALRRLKAFSISEAAYKAGLENVIPHTGFLGRWQMIQRAPKVVLDVSHNTEGFRYLAKQLKQETYQHLFLVMGFVKGKAVRSIIENLPEKAIYFISKPDILRGMELNEVKAELKTLPRDFRYFQSVLDAYTSALEQATAHDFILVCGSTFVVAELLQNKTSQS